MGFNPFRIFKRDNNWTSAEEYSQWDRPPTTNRRRIALIAVGSAVGLFALALFLLSGPSVRNGADVAAGADTPKALVASDSQTNDHSPIPNVLARKKVSAAECSQRRLQLTGDSQGVDRFDLKALDALNKRIGLYNQDCADTNTTAAARETQPDSAAKVATAPQKAAARVATAASTPATPTQTVARPSVDSTAPKKELIDTDTGAKPNDRPKWNPTVLSIQSLLKKQGFDPGPTDGLMGRKTRDAVKAFQTKHGLTPDGLVTLELLEQVLEAHPNAGQKSTFTPNSSQVVKKRAAPVKKPASKAPASSKQPVLTKTALSSAKRTQPVASGRQQGKQAGKAVVKKSTAATGSGGKVTLASLNDFERQTIQWVCAGQTTSSNGPTYDACLQDQVARGRRVGKPDLSKLNTFERQAITRLCATARYEQGLAAYYECAARQRDSVTSISRRPNVSNLGIDVRGAVRRNCDGLQFTESLPVYYRCVATQIARAKR